MTDDGHITDRTDVQYHDVLEHESPVARKRRRVPDLPVQPFQSSQPNQPNQPDQPTRPTYYAPYEAAPMYPRWASPAWSAETIWPPTWPQYTQIPKIKTYVPEAEELPRWWDGGAQTAGPHIIEQPVHQAVPVPVYSRYGKHRFGELVSGVLKSLKCID